MRTTPIVLTSILLTAGACGLAAASAAAAQEHPMLGSPAPELHLESLEGETVALSDFRGDHVVLHFGAGW